MKMEGGITMMTDEVDPDAAKKMLINKISEEYTAKIIDNWRRKGEVLWSSHGISSMAPKQPVSSPPQYGSFVIDKSALTEDVIRRELVRVREEFLIEAKKLESEKISKIERSVKAQYDAQLRRSRDELSRALRIINIQNAIISKLYEKNKNTLIRVLREADISEQELRILSEGI